VGIDKLGKRRLDEDGTSDVDIKENKLGRKVEKLGKEYKQKNLAIARVWNYLNIYNNIFK